MTDQLVYQKEVNMDIKSINFTFNLRFTVDLSNLLFLVSCYWISNGK